MDEKLHLTETSIRYSYRNDAPLSQEAIEEIKRSYEIGYAPRPSDQRENSSPSQPSRTPSGAGDLTS